MAQPHGVTRSGILGIFSAQINLATKMEPDNIAIVRTLRTQVKGNRGAVLAVLREMRFVRSGCPNSRAYSYK